MNKHHLILLAAGVAIGYFAASTLAGYQPWTFAFAQGGALKPAASS